MIAKYWPQWFRNLAGGSWPTEYVSFDLETTGFDRKRDVITEIGHCLTKDNEPIDRLSIILDWSNHPIVPDSWLQKRLADVAKAFEKQGKQYHITYKVMREQGMQPEKALKFYHDFFATLQAKEVLFAAHNGFNFDEPMLAANFAGFKVATDFHLGDNGMFDTACLAKASQLTDDHRMRPKPGDTLRTYFDRIRYARCPGIKSKLDEYCFDVYGFDTKYGLDRAQLHGADMDAYCVHLLMQEFGQHCGPVLPEPVPHGDLLRQNRIPPKLPASPLKQQEMFPPPTPKAGSVRRRKQRNC